MPLSGKLDATFAALADPTRRAILARLSLGEASVTELAEPFAISQPAVSKHLKILEHAGLITRSREAQRRPCKIEVEPIGVAVAWLEEFKRLWAARYDRLDVLLEELKAAGPAAGAALEKKAKKKKKKKDKKEKKRRKEAEDGV